MTTEATGEVAPRQAGSSSLGAAVRGFGVLAASSLLSQLIAFAALAYVARRIGVTNLGAYTLTVTIAGYFGLVANLGVSYLATRDIATRPDDGVSILRQALAIQVPLSILLYGAFIALAPGLVHGDVAVRMVPVVGLLLFTNAATLDWVLLSLGRSRTVATWRLIGQVIYGALVPILVIPGATGAVRYAWLNILGLAVTALGIAWAVVRVAQTRVLPPPRKLKVGLETYVRRTLLPRLRRSLPFGYSLVMIQIYVAVDILLLGLLASTRAVGLYAAANKLPAAVNVFANLWLNVFFPHASHRLTDEPESFRRDLGRIITAAVIIAAAISVGALLCAGSLIPLIFGPGFRSASAPFALLAVAQSLVLLQANFSNVLLAGGRERSFATLLTCAAVAITALDLILIPPYGTVGAAIATVVAEVGLTSATMLAVVRRLGRLPLDGARLMRGLAVIAIMGLATFGARFLGGAVVQVGVAGASFFGASAVFRPFDKRLIQTH